MLIPKKRASRRKTDKTIRKIKKTEESSDIGSQQSIVKSENSDNKNIVSESNDDVGQFLYCWEGCPKPGDSSSTTAQNRKNKKEDCECKSVSYVLLQFDKCESSINESRYLVNTGNSEYKYRYDSRKSLNKHLKDNISIFENIVEDFTIQFKITIPDNSYYPIFRQLLNTKNFLRDLINRYQKSKNLPKFSEPKAKFLRNKFRDEREDIEKFLDKDSFSELVFKILTKFGKEMKDKYGDRAFLNIAKSLIITGHFISNQKERGIEISENKKKYNKSREGSVYLNTKCDSNSSGFLDELRYYIIVKFKNLNKNDKDIKSTINNIIEKNYFDSEIPLSQGFSKENVGVINELFKDLIMNTKFTEFLQNNNDLSLLLFKKNNLEIKRCLIKGLVNVMDCIINKKSIKVFVSKDSQKIDQLKNDIISIYNKLKYNKKKNIYLDNNAAKEEFCTNNKRLEECFNEFGLNFLRDLLDQDLISFSKSIKINDTQFGSLFKLYFQRGFFFKRFNFQDLMVI